MTGPAAPMDIATPRQSSSSPRNQSSNLTSQLHRPSIAIQPDFDIDMKSTVDARPSNGRHESFGHVLGTPRYGSGARPIALKDMPRRESNALATSLMAGMSWGGLSVGSFIRDDVLMAGTSPYAFQSPSFHSSSYLPKMEANYMRDYVCCGINLVSMHELLQHYEEAHAAQPNQTMGKSPKDQQYPSSRAANATSTAQSVQQQAQAQQIHTTQQQFAQTARSFQTNSNPQHNAQNTQDPLPSFDNLEDMEMDESSNIPAMQHIQGSQFQPQPQFGRQQQRVPSVNVNVANAFQGQGLRTSTPTTPHTSQQYPLQHNPTVSSVNTPTLGTQCTSQKTSSPESSMPGTPAELDMDFSNAYGNFNNVDYYQMMQAGFDSNSINQGGQVNGGSACIDDPAKRLLSKQGYGNKGGFPQSALANNGELAKRLREQQILNGLSGVGGFVGEEIKPFKCPVIGCEKAYKNQNGLKYHKQHGHQNQQLKENSDCTFSIVDPTTSIPYPGTVGMEKEKPYRCEVCGKRYKNLNGLKYHRHHSPPCNAESKLNTAAVSGVGNNMQGMNVNVAGAGLMGMNDVMGF